MSAETATSLSTELSFRLLFIYLFIFACLVPVVSGPVGPNKGEEHAGRMIGAKLLTVPSVCRVDMRYVPAGEVHIVLKILSALYKHTRTRSKTDPRVRRKDAFVPCVKPKLHIDSNATEIRYTPILQRCSDWRRHRRFRQRAHCGPFMQGHPIIDISIDRCGVTDLFTY